MNPSAEPKSNFKVYRPEDQEGYVFDITKKFKKPETGAPAANSKPEDPAYSNQEGLTDEGLIASLEGTGARFTAENIELLNGVDTTGLTSEEVAKAQEEIGIKTKLADLSSGVTQKIETVKKKFSPLVDEPTVEAKPKQKFDMGIEEMPARKSRGEALYEKISNSLKNRFVKIADTVYAVDDGLNAANEKIEKFAGDTSAFVAQKGEKIAAFVNQKILTKENMLKIEIGGATAAVELAVGGSIKLLYKGLSSLTRYCIDAYKEATRELKAKHDAEMDRRKFEALKKQKGIKTEQIQKIEQKMKQFEKVTFVDYHLTPTTITSGVSLGAMSGSMDSLMKNTPGMTNEGHNAGGRHEGSRVETAPIQSSATNVAEAIPVQNEVAVEEKNIGLESIPEVISDAEYSKFVDKNEVSEEIYRTIAMKQKAGERITPRELAIASYNSNEINDILKVEKEKEDVEKLKAEAKARYEDQVKKAQEEYNQRTKEIIAAQNARRAAEIAPVQSAAPEVKSQIDSILEDSANDMASFGYGSGIEQPVVAPVAAAETPVEEAPAQKTAKIIELTNTNSTSTAQAA